MAYPLQIMGILNVTPDSFSDGGKYLNVDSAVAHGKKMMRDGAHVIDVGGESTRPNCDLVSENEELRRVVPVVEALCACKIPVSIDTYKPNVARRCCAAGAVWVNDVSGLRNQDMLCVVQEYAVAVVIMHMPGVPKTMQKYTTSYDTIVQDVKNYLVAQVACARRAGIERIIIDPGFGFGKTGEQNSHLLEHLGELEKIGCPILIGPSKKKFIKNGGKLATLDALVLGVKNGASIVRVHGCFVKKGVKIMQQYGS